MALIVKTTTVITAESYGEDGRIRRAISAAAEVLDRNDRAKAKRLTVTEKPGRYGQGKLELRFLMEEQL